jgi:solute carrier family 6 (neurotransmitter transporter, serotonin) member 4
MQSDKINNQSSYNKSNINLTETKLSSSEEYFNRKLLGVQYSNGMQEIGTIKLDLAFCLAIVYILMYLCICKGVRSTGKAVYVTAILPYIILIFLLIHSKLD